MASQKIALPKEKKVKILTTKDNWIPKVVGALRKGKTAILPAGIGAYVLAGAISTKRDGKAIAERINLQKGRHKDRPVAFDVPPYEIPIWVQEAYEEQIEEILSRIMGKPFGILVPASNKIPSWLSVLDKIHGVREKLFVWADPNNIGPLADLYRYVRDELKLGPEEFSLIATSGNLSKQPNNNKFARAYAQLGEKEGIAYAVYDFDEGGQYSDKPTTIFSALPFTRGGEKIHVKRLGSLSREELSSILPQAHFQSPFEAQLYNLHHRTKSILQKFHFKR